MSLPPQIIQVKRKRTEEGPVPSFLRIEHTTKRHRSDAFLYRRHDPEAEAAEAAHAQRPPAIQASKPGDEKEKRRSKGAGGSSVGDVPHDTPVTAGQTTMEPRRFHLSRASGVLGAARGMGVRKLRARPLVGPRGIMATTTTTSMATASLAAETAVFVERSKRRKRAASRDDDCTGDGDDRDQHDVRKRHSLATLGTARAEAHLRDTTPPVASLPKRPSRKRTTVAPSRSADELQETIQDCQDSQGSQGPQPPPVLPALPASIAHRQWDTDMEQLTREMNAYTMEVLGRNLAQMAQDRPASSVSSGATTRVGSDGPMSRWETERRKAALAKYKPKPGPRYMEREEKKRLAGMVTDGDTADEQVTDGGNDGYTDHGHGHDDDASETDEDDYITETYVRIAGHGMPWVTAGAAGSVGLLVFDNEPDMQFFYGVEEESDTEADDDEDENAENYYTHDYPEDEVSSDDEFDRDPYHYRNDNASDEESFVDSDMEDNQP